jgi:hypothetical protein
MSLIQKTCEIILKNLVFQNIFIIILISIFSLLILKKVKNNSKIKNIISIIIYSYTSYVIVFNFISIDNLLLKYTDYFNALITLIYCISIFLVVCLYSKNKNLLLFILISILIMIIPLLVVNPIQSRCMLPPYILLIIFTLLLCKEANINLDKFSYAINIFTIFVLGFMLCIYGYAFKVDNSRINYINENSNSNYLTLPKIPNRSYVYNPNPVSNDYIPYFKEFYNIKDNTEITFVETNEWVK